MLALRLFVAFNSFGIMPLLRHPFIGYFLLNSLLSLLSLHSMHYLPQAALQLLYSKTGKPPSCRVINRYLACLCIAPWRYFFHLLAPLHCWRQFVIHFHHALSRYRLLQFFFSSFLVFIRSFLCITIILFHPFNANLSLFSYSAILFNNLQLGERLYLSILISSNLFIMIAFIVLHKISADLTFFIVSFIWNWIWHFCFSTSQKVVQNGV